MASQPDIEKPTLLWSPPSPANGTSGPADVILVGCDGRAVLAHKTALMHSTEIFDAILGMTVEQSESHASVGAPIRVDMQESGKTLSMVIPLLYNVPSEDTSAYTFNDLLAAYGAAHKFTAYRALELLRTALSDSVYSRYSLRDIDTVSQEAMEAYRLAVKLGDTMLEQNLDGIAWLAINIWNPYVYVDDLGSRRAEKLFVRKRRFHDRLLALLHAHNVNSLKETSWLCHQDAPNHHSELRQTYTEWLWWATYNAGQDRCSKLDLDFIPGDHLDLPTPDEWRYDRKETWQFNSLDACEEEVYGKLISLEHKWEEAWKNALKR